jgi:hypothetical protein
MEGRMESCSGYGRALILPRTLFLLLLLSDKKYLGSHLATNGGRLADVKRQ